MTTEHEGQGREATAPAAAPTHQPEPDRVKIEIEARIIWQAIGAVLTTLVLLWALNQARGIVSMVAISFFFSLALEPAVRKLTARFGW
ncbi:MAG: hypothetical protein GY926_08935, partial [bacterium]|nr:hypothetical protein [bacterium]